MRQKKVFLGVLLMCFLALAFQINCVFAIDMQAGFEPVVKTVLNDHDKPAIFDVNLINNGNQGNFELWTFERMSIKPEQFSLEKGETKKIRFEFYPISTMKDNVGYVPIPLFVRNKDNANDNVPVGKIIVKLVDFRDAFELRPQNINLDSSSFKVLIYNLEDLEYKGLKVVSSSVFSDANEQTIDIKPFERKEITIPVSADKIKTLVAGTYTLNSEFSIDGKTMKVETPVKILEKSGLSVKESSTGIIIRTYSVEKTNEGNVMTIASVELRKSIISRLFTTFSLEPDRVERKGFFVYYDWQKELGPNQKLSVEVITNWIFPFILLVLIIAVGVLVNIFLRQDIEITKKVGFVKTKTSDFALRVTISVRARKFAENIKLYDRLPGIAKLYEKFGEQPAQKDNSGRLQWSIPHLAPGEERTFSYVFYSKVSVVGKFELPQATALYDVEGKPRSSKSNSVFFINEPRHFSVREEEI